MRTVKLELATCCVPHIDISIGCDKIYTTYLIFRTKTAIHLPTPRACESKSGA